MIENVTSRRFSHSLLTLALAGALVFAPGCKKTPPAVTTTPEPPAVQKSEPVVESVKETPLKPVVEEPVASKSMGAAEYNSQGLLKTVYFDFNKFEIRPDQRATLQGNADKLKAAPLSRFRVLIEGHCDERNTNEYNLALGDRRANAVKQYLMTLGIPAARLRTISYGEERPADPGHSEEAWAKNRRGEFVLEEG